MDRVAKSNMNKNKQNIEDAILIRKSHKRECLGDILMVKDKFKVD